MSAKFKSFWELPEPTPFDYVFHGAGLTDPDGKDRKGQPCQLFLGAKGKNTTIGFKDGYTVTVPRITVRRKPEASQCSSSSLPCLSPSSSSRS
jgi:hypothetical protein